MSTNIARLEVLHNRLSDIIEEATKVTPASVGALLLLSEILEVWREIYSLDPTLDNRMNVDYAEHMFLRAFPSVAQA